MTENRPQRPHFPCWTKWTRYCLLSLRYETAITVAICCGTREMQQGSKWLEIRPNWSKNILGLGEGSKIRTDSLCVRNAFSSRSFHICLLVCRIQNSNSCYRLRTMTKIINGHRAGTYMEVVVCVLMNRNQGDYRKRQTEPEFWRLFTADVWCAENSVTEGWEYHFWTWRW